MEEGNLKSLEELYNIIGQDLITQTPSQRRFPVRFIFINSFWELREVVKFLNDNHNVKINEITKLLPNKDGWLTINDIITQIKSLSDNTVIVPLSEFLRFQNDNDLFIALKALTEVEKQNNMRIYIPLVGLWERFEEKFWRRFNRKEWAPIWRLETTSFKIPIYQLNFGFNHQSLLKEKLNNTFIISSTTEWLSIWKKKEGFERIISLSKTLGYFYKNFLPDQTFELIETSNQKEFLEKIFEIKIPVEFRVKEDKLWDELIMEIGKSSKKNTSIEDVFLDHFNLRNTKELAIEDYLRLYLQAELDYEKWLLKNFFLSLEDFKYSYLYKCLENSDTLKQKDLIKQIWTNIFYLPIESINKNVISERRNLLNIIHKGFALPSKFIEEELFTELERIRNYPLKKKLAYLTNITFTEKKYIISELKKNNTEEIWKLHHALKEVYPELIYYLDWNLVKPDNNVDDWILEYFENYNYSKIRHVKAHKIEELINIKNKNKSSFADWYYSLPTAKTEKDIKYIWVDGLGAEWFPLLIHLLNQYGKKKGKIVKNKLLTRINLPSITECNRYDFEKIGDLDKYIHNQNPYEFPDDLIKEIELIEKIVKNILEIQHAKIGILSDHGFSFLCLKAFGNFKRLNLTNSEHDGRCAWINEVDYKDDEYFIVWNTDKGDCKSKKTLVALKHISLSNTPFREVHGGATPEEIIVPYIAIENKESVLEYKIKIINPEVQISNPVVTLKIHPQLSYIPEAFLNGKSLRMSYIEDKDNYQIYLGGLNAGDYEVVVRIGDKDYPIKINVKGGFKETDLL